MPLKYYIIIVSKLVYDIGLITIKKTTSTFTYVWDDVFQDWIIIIIIIRWCHR